MATTKNNNDKELKQSIRRIAVDMFQKFTEGKARAFCLPISTIDGVSVDATVMITQFQKRVGMMMESDELYDGEYNPVRLGHVLLNHCLASQDALVSLGELETALMKLVEVLPTIKFDKAMGRLTNEPKTDTVDEDFMRVLASDNVRLNIDGCCVCLEMTRTTTPCGHFLCYKCWQNIKKGRCDDSTCDCTNHRKCPICRGDITNTE